MEVINNAEAVSTDDLYYDLFQGYLNPTKFLIAKDAKKVEDAISIIEDYLQLLKDEELLEML